MKYIVAILLLCCVLGGYRWGWRVGSQYVICEIEKRIPAPPDPNERFDPNCLLGSTENLKWAI